MEYQSRHGWQRPRPFSLFPSSNWRQSFDDHLVTLLSSYCHHPLILLSPFCHHPLITLLSSYCHHPLILLSPFCHHPLILLTPSCHPIVIIFLSPSCHPIFIILLSSCHPLVILLSSSYRALTVLLWLNPNKPTACLSKHSRSIYNSLYSTNWSVGSRKLNESNYYFGQYPTSQLFTKNTITFRKLALPSSSGKNREEGVYCVGVP
jgi:hypothetical protein